MPSKNAVSETTDKKPPSGPTEAESYFSKFQDSGFVGVFADAAKFDGGLEGLLEAK